jgi:diadenosine tetraphosphatase ApaH/serine/threonine PP2A family protein phosphatase
MVNPGSVGLPFDGDARASYAVVEDGAAVIRRVEYDVDRELRVLDGCGAPGAGWTARIIRARGSVMP